MVRNISATGACLEVTSPFGIPDDFTLVIENDHIQRPCHVSWRKDTRLGVHSISWPPGSAFHKASFMRLIIRFLKNENAATAIEYGLIAAGIERPAG